MANTWANFTFCQFYLSFQRPAFLVSSIFSIVFLIFYSVYFSSDLNCFLPSVYFGFRLFFFQLPQMESEIVYLGIVLFLKGGLDNQELLSQNCFCIPLILKSRVSIFICFKIIFGSCFISSLTHWLFRSMLFSLYIVVYNPNLLYSFLPVVDF